MAMLVFGFLLALVLAMLTVALAVLVGLVGVGGLLVVLVLVLALVVPIFAVLLHGRAYLPGTSDRSFAAYAT